MTTNVEHELAAEVASYSLDPLRFVLFAFPWGVPGTELAESSGPREWQRKVLNDIGKRLKAGYEPGAALMPVLKAVASGHGIGKSALVSWLIAWALCTCEDTKVVLTANTEQQLRTKTWPELSKWFRIMITAHWWKVQGVSVHSLQPGHEKTWRCDAVTWSEENLEAFAGLHNKGKRIVLLFDEASGIADKVWEVAEGAMTDEDTEIVWCAFGNPTQPSGRFFQCFNRFRHRWNGEQIDSRTVPGTNKVQLEQWVTDYGEDSDFVRVRVRGVFPRAGSTQFISTEVAEQAARREVAAGLYDPIIMGVDVARFGDDQSVIVIRKGRDARMMGTIKLRNVDTMQLAARVADEAKRWKADGVFIDGGGVGGGVVDRCRQLRVPGVVEVQFGGGADRAHFDEEKVAYANKRAEMWGLMREWLKGGAVENDPDLIADLTNVQYGFNMRNEIQLERKEDMKKRGLASPDCFVAGTMVSTPRGDRAIETLAVGDVVDTPFGTQPVIAAWCSDADSLTGAIFSNGRSLVGTGKHKVFCWGAGAKRLDALTLTDRMEPRTKARKAAWRMLSAYRIVARNTEFKHLVDIISQTGEVTPSAFFIAVCGQIITKLSQMAWKSTMSIMTGETTPLQTCNSSTLSSIGVSTCASDIVSRAGWMPRIGRLPKLASRLRNGMGLWMGLHGTQSMDGKPGLVELQLKRSALDAASHSRHFFRRGLGFAAARVCRAVHSELTSRMSVIAHGVEKFSARTGIERRPVVPVHVQTGSVPPTPVFNLTLARHNAYYANGLLVFNCGDALALTFAYPVAPSALSGTGMPAVQRQRQYDPHGGV